MEAITIWCLVLKKDPTTLDIAFGVTVLPLLLRACYNIVYQLPEKFQYNHTLEYGTFFVYALTVYSTFRDHDLNSKYDAMPLMAVLLGLWETVRGLVLFVKPDLYGKQKQQLKDETEKVAIRNYGNNIFSTGAFLVALSLGVDIYHAFAYAWLLCATLMTILTLISDDDAQAKGANIAWAVIMALVSAMALP